jgi:CDP-diacylglycerol--glycerol-3-phosphate 3-phosphatidyltransferase
MSVIVASSELSDSQFLAAVADGSLPLESFHHGDHLRLAWLKLHGLPFPEALTQIRNTIRSYASHHGKAAIYHETITTAWVALLASQREATFTDFLRTNEPLLNKALLERYWSPQILYSPEARDAWVPPDRAPLPVDPSILNSISGTEKCVDGAAKEK